MHIDEVKSSKCKYFFMHQIREMHILLPAVIMTWEHWVILSEIVFSKYYTALFEKKIPRPFHKETQWQTQFVQFIKKEKEEGERMNLKSCQLFKCELNIVVRHEGFFF